MTATSFAFYLGAFAATLGILIVVHELGHFAVARLVGVKVLRFSVGFGRPLVIARFGADQTEWAISVFPLGGYVKMLDEREGPVEAHELPRAFNRLPIGKRIMVVVAGPLANLFLAVLIYWLLFMHGSEELRPVLAAPPAASAAAAAGLADGETVRSINGKAVTTWQDMRWEILAAAIEKQSVTLEVINRRQEIASRRIETQDLSAADLEADLSQRLGLLLYRPKLAAVVGRVIAGSVAEKAGIRDGDIFIAVGNRQVNSWNEVATLISQAPARQLQFELQRGGQTLTLLATPASVEEGGRAVGRIGIMVKDDPQLRAEMLTTVRYGVFSAFTRAVTQTWDTSLFTLKMIGRMISGEASWKNLSGPVTIADYAGQSASLGGSQYLKFLAIISISLGVLNLLPIPILDGGHLLYYVIEFLKGGPLSERVMEIGQQIGLFLLLLLMAFAFYNDINRLLSG